MEDSIFVSYSREDRVYVDRITDELKNASLSVWRDTENLEPGTIDWEDAIRSAIEQSVAVILIASPNSRKSKFVQGELTLAKLHKRPIYPIWAYGDNWINCVPLDMANHQYADGRGEQFGGAVAKVISIVKAIMDTSMGKIRIGLASHEVVELSLAAYPSVRDLLDDLFVQYGVHDWFDIWTYGKDWVLANVKSKQLLLPFSWLTSDKSKGVSAHDYDWAQIPLSDFNVMAGDYWAVWSFGELPVAGFLLNTRSTFDKILSPYGSREIEKMVNQYHLIPYPSDEFGTIPEPQSFEYTLLLANIGKINFEDKLFQDYYRFVIYEELS